MAKYSFGPPFSSIALGSFVPAYVGFARFVLTIIYISLGNPLGGEAGALRRFGTR